MKSVTFKIKNLISNKKLNVFLLFIVLAFTILILTKLSKNYTGTINFEITPININDRYVLLNKKENTFKITLETHGFNWLNYAFNRPELEVDFNTDVTKRDSVFIWSNAKGFSTINEQFNKDENIKSINPDTLLFKFDVNAVKFVPVRLDANINYSQGFNSLQTIKIQPDSVKLIGPASLLQEVKSITTKNIIFDNLKTNVNSIVNLKLDSLNSEIKLNTKQVKLQFKVSKFTEGIVSVPITVTNVPNGFKVNYFPKEVTIRYATSLENYKNISKQDFKVICNFETSKSNSFLIPSLIKQPKSIVNARIQQQKIEFVITE